jgi:murein DD-endopeptidase MepM/ murein hydrolase activator NlpD
MSNDLIRGNMKTKIIALFILLMTNGVIPGMTVYADSGMPVCTAFFTPFQEKEREAYRTFLKHCSGSYGDYRKSDVPGHLHAGQDLRGKKAEQVYAVGVGRVAYRYWIFPNETVVLEHRLPNSEIIYSAYTHIRDIQVKIGDRVNENTVIGRLFNAEEMKKARFSSIHLHFEIRKKVDDFGRASYTSMSKKELDQYCMDPKIFLKKHMK